MEQYIYNLCCNYDIELIKNILNTPDKNTLIEFLCYHKFIDILVYLEKSSIIGTDELILTSIKYNNFDLIQYCSNHELNNINEIELQTGRYANYDICLWITENLSLDIEKICIGAAEANRLDLILYYDEIFELPLDEIVLTAAKFGHINIIKYFEDYENIDMHSILLESLNEMKLNVLEWYFNEHQDIFESCNFMDEILETAAENGNIELIEFIEKNYEITNYQQILENATYKHHNNIVLKYINYIDDINMIAVECCYTDNIDIFKVCYSLEQLNKKKFIKLCNKYKSIRILEFLS